MAGPERSIDRRAEPRRPELRRARPSRSERRRAARRRSSRRAGSASTGRGRAPAGRGDGRGTTPTARKRAASWGGPRSATAALLVVLLLAVPTVDGARAARAVRAPHPLPHRAYVAQTHPQGCGAAVLAAMLRAHGLPGDPERLLAEAPPGPRGVDLAAFARLAERRGLPGRWIRTSHGRPPAGPFVAHLSRPVSHLVWVVDRAHGHLTVLDPDAGVQVWRTDAFLARASGRWFLLDAPPVAPAEIEAALAAAATAPAASGRKAPS